MDKFESLLTEKGIYGKVEVDISDLPDIEKYLSGSLNKGNVIDCYCPTCKAPRSFEFFDSEVHTGTGMVRIALPNQPLVADSPRPHERFQRYLGRRYVLTYKCTRDGNQTILFDLILTDSELIKVGQYPPRAILDRSKFGKYKKLLGAQYIELTTAVWLAAEGIGIGSFVYFRRIIENLVFEKYAEHKESLEISECDFSRLKFDKKIETLKDYLPEALVKNKAIYGIVSKGIHELSEEECLDMFQPLLIGIELILDEVLAQKEKEKREKELQSFISKKSEELG